MYNRYVKLVLSKVVLLMNTVETILRLIGDYGFPLVTSAVTIVVFLLMAKRNMEEQKKCAKMQRELIEHFIYDGHSPSEERKNTEINAQIETVTRNLLQELSADSVGVMMYRNGGRDLTGRPFQNMSCISEVTSGGQRPIMASYGIIPRSTFSTIVNDLHDEGHCHIQDIETIKNTDSATYYAFSDYGIKSVYAKPLRNIETNTNIGFIGVAFRNKPDNEAIIVEKLFRVSYQIEALLSTPLKD